MKVSRFKVFMLLHEYVPAPSLQFDASRRVITKLSPHTQWTQVYSIGRDCNGWLGVLKSGLVDL